MGFAAPERLLCGHREISLWRQRDFSVATERSVCGHRENPPSVFGRVWGGEAPPAKFLRRRFGRFRRRLGFVFCDDDDDDDVVVDAVVDAVVVVVDAVAAAVVV